MGRQTWRVLGKAQRVPPVLLLLLLLLLVQAGAGAKPLLLVLLLLRAPTKQRCQVWWHLPLLWLLLVVLPVLAQQWCQAVGGRTACRRGGRDKALTMTVEKSA